MAEAAPAFVDCHSHVVPSGDDGVQSVAHGVELCTDAARHGTAVLFATPHVWPHLPLTPERRKAVEIAYAVLRDRVGLDVRLGYELTPSTALMNDDLRSYALASTSCVLLDTPFSGPLGILFGLAERAESQGLRPVIAHPERSEAAHDDPDVLDELASRSWLLQVNATSLLGRHGEDSEELGWRLIDSRLAALVASDGHRMSRPARLDEAFAASRARVGEAADRLYDGSALGVSAGRTRSPAASRGV